MKVLKGCLIKWVIFLGMGLGICSLLIAADIEYGDFFMPFFTFMIGLTAVVGLIIFLILLYILILTDNEPLCNHQKSIDCLPSQ